MKEEPQNRLEKRKCSEFSWNSRNTLQKLHETMNKERKKKKKNDVGLKKEKETKRK